MSNIIVVGSSNTDMVVKTPRFPQQGETVLGGDFFMFPGGKGANQAVAAARLGAKVSFICCVGTDVFGDTALIGYEQEGLDIGSAIQLKDAPSGVALITVNQQGENQIVVASGANKMLSVAHLQKSAKPLRAGKVLLTQLETPMEVVSFLAAHCRETGQLLIINPAPAQKLSDDILDKLFLITPNETETRILTGVEVTKAAHAEKAGAVFLKKGVQNVIITMGSRGAYFMNAKEQFTLSAPKVTAKDTTAAGDVFNGALAASLLTQKPWKAHVNFANQAAALSVTKMGAQASAPYLHEITKF